MRMILEHPPRVSHLLIFLALDMLLDGDELEFENEEPVEGEYISDFPTNEKPVDPKKPAKHVNRQSIP
jgi:hypothetical protein